MCQKQVDKEHYQFDKYVNKKRWMSIWHQVDELLAVNPKSALEIGPGPGLFKSLAEHFGISVVTMDLDQELRPDYVGSATDLPFKDNVFDCVCAFQVLEHLPYKKALQAFEEMIRVTRNHIIISLPDSRTLYPCYFHLPKIGKVIYNIPSPRFWSTPHKFNGLHYWEINKKDYGLRKIIYDFTQKKVVIKKTYRVKENPYYRFFIFCKKKD